MMDQNNEKEPENHSENEIIPTPFHLNTASFKKETAKCSILGFIINILLAAFWIFVFALISGIFVNGIVEEKKKLSICIYYMASLLLLSHHVYALVDSEY